MNKKNELFEESIQQKLLEMKEDSVPQEEKKAGVKKLPAVIIAVVFVLSVILRFFF